MSTTIVILFFLLLQPPAHAEEQEEIIEDDGVGGLAFRIVRTPIRDTEHRNAPGLRGRTVHRSSRVHSRGSQQGVELRSAASGPKTRLWRREGL